MFSFESHRSRVYPLDIGILLTLQIVIERRKLEEENLEYVLLRIVRKLEQSSVATLDLLYILHEYSPSYSVGRLLLTSLLPREELDPFNEG